MTTFHLSGFPRVGAKRELKFAQERYWRGEIAEADLLDIAKKLREINWQHQANANADFVAVADFTFYDHILDLQVATGAIPARFGFDSQNLTLNQYFQLARGNKTQFAIEMTKWFDTNYHYLVPEFHKDTQFKANPAHYVQQIREAKALGHKVKPTIVGPLTFLWLGKEKGAAFNRFDLLNQLVPVYVDILNALTAEGVEYIQIDEPALTLDLPAEWITAYKAVYATFAAQVNAKLLLATYFGSVAEHADLLKALPVAGLHIDLVRAPEQVYEFVDYDKILSVGVIDGRNIWRANLNQVLDVVEPLKAKLGERLWIAPSCSLLHTPYDLAVETQLQANKPELYQWLAFTLQKIQELRVIKTALEQGRAAVQADLDASQTAADARKNSREIHRTCVAERLANLPKNADQRKSPFAERIKLQNAWLNLPLLPTTNIGSFPQTTEIRHARAAFKKGDLSLADYEAAMKKEIEFVVREQEKLDLDVLVHGEAERNDMVEYFGENLSGYLFSKNGWVQSYGTRGVKPPIIWGDVKRERPITVKWSAYAQAQSDLPVKGMLTGPVTILNWSFPREDITIKESTLQIALAIREEVLDLEAAGIHIIQIDEAALREKLPLRKSDWYSEYLDWAIPAFRLVHSGVAPTTQIHTHMCYSEFTDIIPAIEQLDADVISFEASRSNLHILDELERQNFQLQVGPGVYDIHSPRVPSVEEIEHTIRAILAKVPTERVWINPDCGLKTRGIPETKASLVNLTQATRNIREEL